MVNIEEYFAKHKNISTKDSLKKFLRIYNDGHLEFIKYVSKDLVF